MAEVNTFIGAAELFDLARMKTLLEEGSSVDEKNERGDTALHLCVARDDFVKFLLENKASPNSKNDIGSTPLHKAAISNNKRSISALLAANADNNARNDAGFYPDNYATNDRIIRQILGSNLHEVTVPVKDKTALVIGAGGSTLKRIQTDTRTYIQVPKDIGEARAIITGRKDDVLAAKDIIRNIVYPNRDAPGADRDDARPTGPNVKLPINKQKHGLIIGKKGSTLKQIQKDFNVTVTVPKQDSGSDTIEIQGQSHDDIHAAVSFIHKLTSAKAQNQRSREGSAGSSPAQGARRGRRPNNGPVPTRVSNTLPINHR